MSLPLPSDTREFLTPNRLDRCSNPGLLFTKYVNEWTQRNGTWELGEKKKTFLERVCRSVGQGAWKETLKAVLERQQAFLRSLQESGWAVQGASLETDYRLVTGLGSAHVLETGFVFHPLYGFPYLPASGVKGVARAYAETIKNTTEGDGDILVVFGSEKKGKTLKSQIRGKVLFLDAYPVDRVQLDLDIMNPHYADYYHGDKPPADYLQPNPVFFIAVAPGQRFHFRLASRDKGLAEKAFAWLIGGLTQLGAGGKTSVGYGYFKHPPEPGNAAGPGKQGTPRTSTPIFRFG